jgi:indolepyruvate ferredoxin oxidoreductase beta subunit
MTADRPICVVIAALGGQGGGVLADWLVTAARHDGFPAQMTSIPGVAQRTGATTYYFELFPEKAPPKDPVFSIYPSSGDVSLLAALEPTEAGRALAQGFVGGGTTVVTTPERVFSTAEKMHAGDGTIAAAPVLEALTRAGKDVLTVDLRAIATKTRCQPNAVMFGAIAETGVLPITRQAYQAAITHSGVAVEANLAGFDAGAAAASAPRQTAEEKAGPGFDPAPAKLAATVGEFPSAIRPMVGHGLARLVDYQSIRYGRLYLERLRTIVALDDADDRRLSLAVARRLAAWMSYEDVIRVAQLKTRPGRLARIRAEAGAPDDAPFIVQDFLKPGREEFEGLIPRFLAPLMPRAPHRASGRGLAMRLNAASPGGHLAFRVLASLRPWRRVSIQYKREQAAIERWLSAVAAAVPRGYDLACDTANAAVWARGYGAVRARGLKRLEILFNDWEPRLDADAEAVAAAVRKALDNAYTDPDGEPEP